MTLLFIQQLYSGTAQSDSTAMPMERNMWRQQQEILANYPAYAGNDLGLQYEPGMSRFRIWAPTAGAAELLIYRHADDSIPSSVIAMTKAEKGTWTATVQDDLLFRAYTFRVQINGRWMNEVPDPYVKATTVNGKKGMVVNLGATNPEGWQLDRSPPFNAKTDAIIYELHLRDVSICPGSGIDQKGKFLGLTEKGTRSREGLPTGLDHIRELGVTHVHLLPSFDLASIDESTPHIPQYNWGYDPLNYNVPEGSYASNANDGISRIREFKQLVKIFHENGLRVVMDVAYNHTSQTESSLFNQLVPGYYYRQGVDGGFSNATACGNETASERYMMRKFILESMKYWVEEYHIDGFRIDLMGVHDIETMNLVSRELHRLKPDILLYGEGWTAGFSPLPDSLRALKRNAYKLDRIAVFSDDIRDGIKGNVFAHREAGFVSGKQETEESIKFGIVASLNHPQVDFRKVNYSKAPYAAEPFHTITYVDCHDNHTLWDKLELSAPGYSPEQRKSMHKLALAIVLTSQGIPFLHAGTEFLRSKKGVENSFESPDSINQIDWSLKFENRPVFEYVKNLVRLRKDHPAFRMGSARDIVDHLSFLDNMPPLIVAYTINGGAVGDKWKKILVFLNGNNKKISLPLPQGSWNRWIPENAKEAPFNNGQLLLNPFSCAILFQQ